MNPILEEDLSYIVNNTLIDWQKLDKRSFLISGAAGFIGSLLVKCLYYASIKHKLYIEVLALVKDRESAEIVFNDLQKKEFFKLKLFETDIRNEIKINEKPDYIIHCASPTKSLFFINNPVDTIETIVLGTDNILKFACARDVSKVLCLSSMEVYGQPDKYKKMIMEEDIGYLDPLSVRSSYSEGKRMMECLCVSAVNEYGLNISIGRLAQTFGAGVSLSDNRIFMQLAESVIDGRDIVLHTEGLSEGNYIYSADAITAIFVLLEKGNAAEAYNIVNEKCHTSIREMAEMVAKKHGDKKTGVVFDIAENYKTGYAPDVKMKLSAEKIKKLGWQPETDLETAYGRLIAYLKYEMRKK